MMNEVRNSQDKKVDTACNLVKPRPLYQLFPETVDKIERTFIKISDYIKNASKNKKKEYFRYLKGVNKLSVDKSAIKIIETVKTALCLAGK